MFPDPIKLKQSPPHVQLGKFLATKLKGFTTTKDIEGQGVLEHGSPWKAPGDQLAMLAQVLRQQGYRPAGKNVWRRGPVRVEAAVYEGNTRVYITDDNK